MLTASEPTKEQRPHSNDLTLTLRIHVDSKLLKDEEEFAWLWLTAHVHDHLRIVQRLIQELEGTVLQVDKACLAVVDEVPHAESARVANEQLPVGDSERLNMLFC